MFGRRLHVVQEPLDRLRYQPRSLPKSLDVSTWMLVSDLDGVPFYDADLPVANHVCWAQTIVWTGRFRETRCPCGGHRVNKGRWTMRNARRS